MKLTRFKLAFLSYALFDLLIGGHCGGLLPLNDMAAAQTTPVYGNITAASSSCLSTNCVSLQLDGNTGAATIQLTGTFVATVSFEASNDNGTTWVAINGTPPNSTSAVSSATATGMWQFNVAGFTNLRARGSAYTSGTAVAVINSAHASAKSGGGAVFASGGTTNNVIPKSNGSSLLVDSALSDNGTNVTSSEAILAPIGTSTLPGYSFSGGSNQAASGIMWNALGTSMISSNGTIGWLTVGIGAGGVSIRSDAPYGWNSSTTVNGGTFIDTQFVRDGAANVIAQKNGNNDQKFRVYGTNGGFVEYGASSELLTLSTVGATTDTTGNLLPANSVIDAVDARVTTTITTATDWKLGDATIAARFSIANSTLTAGTTQVGDLQADQTGSSGPRQVAAAKVRVTTTGTPGAGVIRITVHYHSFTPPTS